MRARFWLGVVTVLLLPLAASLAGAEEVVETWRSPVGLYPRDVAASPASNSCWVAYSDPEAYLGPVAQLAADGTPLLQTDAFSGPLAVNPADGSIWLRGADTGSGEGWLVHLAADGTELVRAWPGMIFHGLAVDPTDGSCWMVEGYRDAGSMGAYWYGGLAHVAVDGSALLKVQGLNPRWSVSVNPGDHSVWVAQGGQGEVVHLTREGVALYQGLTGAGSVSVDPQDGSCWVGGRGFVAHLAADGSELWRGDSYGTDGESWEHWGAPACAVAVSPSDHTCWITDRTDVVRLAPDGAELSRAPGFDFSTIRIWSTAPGLSASPMDGSCWVADVGHSQVARLAVVGATGHFRDVPSDSWAFAEIEACAAAGVVEGFPDGSYRPGLAVTRDQMAAYIARAMMTASEPAGMEVPDGPAEPTFHDVGVGHWAYKYIEFCAAEGVVQGYPGGAYHPDEPVNRGQMAVYMAHSITIPTGAPDPDDFVPPAGAIFPDVTAGDDWAWCFRYVEYIAMLPTPITLGYPDGAYHPEVVVTRDQMAVYILRGFGLPM